jgi:hypothetical protein
MAASLRQTAEGQTARARVLGYHRLFGVCVSPHEAPRAPTPWRLALTFVGLALAATVGLFLVRIDEPPLAAPQASAAPTAARAPADGEMTISSPPRALVLGPRSAPSAALSTTASTPAQPPGEN